VGVDGREVQLRTVDPEADLALVGRWMNAEHVARWWEYANDPSALLAHLNAQRDREGHQSWIAACDGLELGYLETYTVVSDDLANHYDASPEDRGWHFLVGDQALLGTGIPRSVARGVVIGLARTDPATRVVCEPDIRNKRMIRFCEALGHKHVDTIELPDKTAALMVADRDSLVPLFGPALAGTPVPPEVAWTPST
jgi:RimJ/RimL family protein N-acetyltransferase